MDVLHIIIVLATVWLVAVLIGWLIVVPWLRVAPDGNAVTGLLWRATRLYCALWHRVTHVAASHVPDTPDPERGLIVVSNHTGAIDPLLIQSECRFIVRWMMASEMMVPSLNWFWKRHDLIPVDRDGDDTAALREAIRYVKAGGCLGIFPEGRIPVPPREIRPFFPGVGVLVRRTHAPVLLIWVSGTPDTNKMGEALATRSHSRVEYVGIIEYDKSMKAEQVTQDLRLRIRAVSDWPLNDIVIPPGGPISGEQPDPL